MEKARLHALQVAGLYLASGLLWIALSDKALLLMVQDVERLSGLQTAKGWFYVIATAVLLYALLLGMLRRLHRSQLQLQRAETMAALGRMAAGISHDFRNVLTVIAGNAELAANKAAPGPVQEELAQIRSMVEKGQQQVQQLMAFARGQQTQVQALELGALVLDLAPMLKKLLPPLAFLRVQAEPVGARVNADRNSLEQALMNLVSNAVDAFPPGGNGAQVTVSVSSAHGRVRLQVADNGAGMPADVQEHIFEPFFSTKPDGHGTGLGLATVYTTVLAHKGSIDVQSSLGEGSTFSIDLPLAD